MKTAARSRRKITFLFTGTAAAILVLAAVSLCVGKYRLGAGEILSLIFGGNGASEMSGRVFFTLRLPRTAMAILAGAGLGMAGSVYQLIFKNPLASPGIIGVSGGANLGAAAAIVLISSSGTFFTAIGSFVGGVVAVLCVLMIAFASRSHSTTVYVLSGIIVNAVSEALITALKYFADPENELAAMEYWEMGSLGNVTRDKVLAILPLFAIGFIGITLMRRQIEMMSLNDNESRSLGLRLRPMRIVVLLLNTLLVSSVVCITGLISFAGLIAPHIARLMLKRNDSVMMLFSGLVGGFVVLGADLLSRSVYTVELPISIFTTVVGVPLLILFLRDRKKRAI